MRVEEVVIGRCGSVPSFRSSSACQGSGSPTDRASGHAPRPANRPATLTLRERQVLGYRALGHPLKLIAYELGVGISSVSGTLKSGMQKLGVKSAAELMRAFAPGAPQT